MSARSNHTLAIRELDWQLDTKTVFGLFAAKPWSMLLDSGFSDHIDARYDIIAIDPIATLTANSGSAADSYSNQFTALSDVIAYELADAIKQQTQSCNAFDALDVVKQQLYPKSSDTHLPFSSGALGAFNYDLGRQLEKLPATAADDISLPAMNVGFYDFVLLFDYANSQWLACHYQGETALEQKLAEIEQLITAAESNSDSFTHSLVNKAEFKLYKGWQTQISRDEYLAKFDQVQEYLLSGDCYQINLTQRFEAKYQGDEWQAYCTLTAANKAPFSAFMRLPEHCILSISPERFIQVNQHQIQTKPIKGTLPRGATPEQDALLAAQLKLSEKDRAENLMIVDLLRNDVSRVAAPGSVAVPKLFDVESFPAVHHLVSTVTATIDKGKSCVDVLKATFPGGSITGAPKIRAMEIIEELEPSRRSMYCGSIGYISQDNKMDTSITIRTLVTDKQNIYCWAGGGIVADSKGDAEYQESFDKVSKILPVLDNGTL
ncbi:aminodeoxychorismate synthase component I [Shewanella maritima]|uniref:aminodeoxychorismate synthase n=1 Tax=Shewanella maritima TaxID=2520507 RepID=A0A411PDT7_9GAMM|nr:aminodeoxychorismate synthase component I [Shewanella maritima]QBF81540.1 aminodeoxychorismate synthase component I [Shewanella maritima]